MDEMKVWSVDDILYSKSILGVPHFQRGLVWNDDNDALLLESLYFDTPCGNIILWEPQTKTNDGTHGIPLDDGKAKETQSEGTKYYIVDGQQRIRTLCKIKEEIDSTCPECKTSGEVPYVWAVNLAEFAKVLGQPKLFESGKVDSLFVKIKDPVLQKRSYIAYAKGKLSSLADKDKKENKKRSQLTPEYRNQYNFVPIRIIMHENFNPNEVIINYNDKIIKNIYDAKDETELKNKLKPDKIIFGDFAENSDYKSKNNLEEKKIFLLDRLDEYIDKNKNDSFLLIWLIKTLTTRTKRPWRNS